MSFRGRSFRPRALNRPPRSRGGPPGIRGSFRFQAPESYAGRHASSSHDDYPVSERRSFEERDRFHRVRSPDEEVGILNFFLVVDRLPARIQAFSFLCTFVPGSEKSAERTFAPVELSFRGTFVQHSLLGTFAPVELLFLRSERSRNFRSVEHSLPWNFRSSGVNVPRTFVPMKLLFHENEYSKNFRSKCPKT